jgi:hypothetical protein
MKKIIIILIMVFTTLTYIKSQIPINVNVRLGDSEAKGLVGTEIQVSNFSLSAGYRPALVIGKSINSFNFALTYYFNNKPLESSWYVSMGRSSKGIIYQDNTYLISYTPTPYYVYEYVGEPAYTVIGGYRFNLIQIFKRTHNKLTADVGAGYNFGEHGKDFIFEFIINYSIFKNKF